MPPKSLAPTPAPTLTDEQSLIGSSFLPAAVTVAGRSISLGDVVAKAHQASGLTAGDWNKLDGADIEGRLVNALVEMVGEAAAARPRAVLERIAGFGFGSDERPSPATRAIEELKKIAADALRS